MRNYAHLPSGSVDRARELRREATDAERKLWRALQEHLPAAKWRRQVPHGPYYVDFLSFPAKLVIEVDGSQHAEATQYDAARTRYLERQGYRVLRYWNNEVLENIDGVVEAVAASLSPSPSHAAPQRGSLPLPKGEGSEQSHLSLREGEGPRPQAWEGEGDHSRTAPRESLDTVSGTVER